MMIIRFPLFFTVFLTALLAGFSAGEFLDPINDVFGSQMEAMIMPGVTIPNNDQFNFLLIGVDDMDRTEANLESIWLVAHARNSSKVTLIPVFPAPDNPDQNLRLAEAFYMDGGKPSIAFWEAMRKTNFWWKGYLISDITTSIKLVDILGGIKIDNQQMNGLEAISSISSWRKEPASAVNQQKLYLEGICNQIASDQAYNLQAMSEILDHSLRSNTQTKVFLAGWATIATSDEKLTCTFPTLTPKSLQATIVSP